MYFCATWREVSLIAMTDYLEAEILKVEGKTDLALFSLLCCVFAIFRLRVALLL